MSARDHDPLCADFNKDARVWCICERLAAAREAGIREAIAAVEGITAPDADTSSAFIAGVADGYTTAIAHATDALRALLPDGGA